MAITTTSIKALDTLIAWLSKPAILEETLPDNEQLLAPYQAFLGSVARLGSGRAQC
jgi:hypothetical protein